MADHELPEFVWLDSKRFNQTDPRTPLFDGLWAVLMASHTDDPAPPQAEALAVDVAEEQTDPHRYARADGSVYERFDPDKFEEAN